MLSYGFNFDTLYYLDLDILYDIARMILGEDIHIAPDYDVIIRGCIIPFLRNATKTNKDADKNTVMRQASISVAKLLKISFKNWDQVSTDTIASAILAEIRSRLTKRLDELNEKEKTQVLGTARNNLAASAKTMGLPLAGAGAIFAGELSGFGVYLATTTGIHAVSLALGTTFSWGVYQGAATLLGVVLGPIGWAIAGVGLVGSAAVSVHNWIKSKQDGKLVMVVVSLLFAIGESPFEFFGLASGASCYRPHYLVQKRQIWAK